MQTMDIRENMEFEERFFSFFYKNITSISKDSEQVRNELGQLLSEFGNKNEILKILFTLKEFSECKNQMDFELQIIHCLKYIARNHGLPASLSPILIHSMKYSENKGKENLSLRRKFQIGQILKYSLMHQEDFVRFNDLLEILETFVARFPSPIKKCETHCQLLAQNIMFQLVECLCLKLSKNIVDSELSDKILKYLPFASESVRLETLKRLEKWKIFNFSNQPNIRDPQNLFEDKTASDRNELFETGSSILQTTWRNRKVKKNISCDVVKTQQVVMTTHVHNVSEATEIQNISLAKVLSNNRGKNIQRNNSQATFSVRKGGTGSDRCWYRTSGWEISHLLDKAESSILIKEEDIHWLRDKTNFGFNVWNTSISMFDYLKISLIFCKVVKYQNINENVMNDLTENFFSTTLPLSYNSCRMNFLLAIETFAKQKNGKISERMSNYLNWFKDDVSCTTGMKRLIWKILSQDDTNLFTSFELALNQLLQDLVSIVKNTIPASFDKTILSWSDLGFILKEVFLSIPELVRDQHPSLNSRLKQKYSSEDSRRELTKECIDSLNYIASQIVFEQRAVDLENKFCFIGKLYEIIKSQQEILPEISILAAEIIENYLSHRSSKGLSKEQTDFYSSLLKRYEDDVFGWSLDERQKYKKTLLKSILSTLEKTVDNVSYNPCQSATTDISETMEKLVDFCTREKDLEMEALVVLALSNVVNQKINADSASTLELPSCHKLAYKLLKTDKVDEHGQVLIGNESENLLPNETYISSFVANILLKCYLGIDACEIQQTTNFVIEAIQESPDKLTRIFCSKFLFKLVSISTTESNVLTISQIKSVYPLISDPVWDIQVYLTCVFCQGLATSSIDLMLDSEDLIDLSHLFVTEFSFLLNENDFVQYVNQPILKILEIQAPLIQFPEETFQLFTFLLNSYDVSEEMQKHVFMILEKQFHSLKTPICPLHTMRSVERIYEGLSLLKPFAADTLFLLSSQSGAILSDDVVDHIYKDIAFSTETSNEVKAAFKLLSSAQLNQELPQYVYENLHMNYLSSLVVLLLRCNEQNQSNPNTVSILVKHFNIRNYCECLANYQKMGRRLSTEDMNALGILIERRIHVPFVIKNLIFSTENGQSLLVNVKSAIFETAGQDENTELLLSLALTLVQSSQSLPDKFVGQMIEGFCSKSKDGLVLIEDGSCYMFLRILTRLVNKNQSPLPESQRLITCLCNLWWNWNSNGQTMSFSSRFASLLSQRSNDSDSETTSNRNNQYRLELLCALQGMMCAKSKLLNEKNNDGNRIRLNNVQTIFRSAMRDENNEIKEQGILSFMEMKLNEGLFCDEKDWRYLFSLQISNQCSPKVVEKIKDFMSENLILKNVPKCLVDEITFLQNFQTMDDVKFLKQVKLFGKQNGVKSKEILELFRSENFMTRFESMFSSDDVTWEAIEVIPILINIISISPLILEKVGFLMPSKQGDEKFENAFYQILKEIVDSKQTKLITNTLMSYLAASTNCEILEILLKIEESRECGDSKLNLEIRRRINSRKLSSYINATYNFGETEIMQIVSEANSLDSFNEIKMSQSTICRLIDFMSTSSLKSNVFQILIEMLLPNLLSMNFNLPRVTCRKLGKIMGEALKDEEFCFREVILEDESEKILSTKSSSLFFKTFSRIIIEGHCDLVDIVESIDILSELFSRFEYAENTQICFAILKCIADGIHFMGISYKLHKIEPQKPMLSMKTCYLLWKQFQSSFTKFRNISFQALMSILSDFADLSEMNIKLIQLELRSHINEIFALIFQNDLSEMAKCMQDIDFTTKFIKFLYSLKYWDLQSLSKFSHDRSQWKRILSISNFLAFFAPLHDSAALKIAVLLQELYKTSEKNAEKLVQFLVEKFEEVEEVGGVHLSVELVMRSLKALTQLPQDESLEFLVSEGYEAFKPCFVIIASDADDVSCMLLGIQCNLVMKFIEEKHSGKKSQEHITLMTNNLIQVTESIHFSQELMKDIDKIADIKDFDNLIDILQLIKSKLGSSYLKDILKETVEAPSVKCSSLRVECLTLIIKSKYLKFLLPSFITKRRQTTERCFRKMLRNGVSLVQIQSFITLALVRTKNQYLSKESTSKKCEDQGDFIQIFQHVINQAVQFKINSNLFENLTKHLSNLDGKWKPSECIDTCNKTVNDFVFDEGGVSRRVEKNVDQLIRDFQTTNVWSFSYKDLENNIIAINECDQPSQIIKTDSRNICKWTKMDISNWAEKVKDKKGHVSMVEMLMVVKQAFCIVTGFQLSPVQSMTCLVALQSNQQKGQFFQVATGLGKSVIIAILAVIKCLEGKRVDVYTSSSVLAERDSREWSKFYNVFGLTCDFNSDKINGYISGQKTCYKQNVVYGDMSQFQFDYLRHHYSGLDTMADRQCDLAIIDEVDSMLIDDSFKLARLSSTIPGMDLLHIVYLLMWNRLTFVKNRLFSVLGNIYYLEGQIQTNFSENARTATISYSFADAESSELCNIPDLVGYIICGGDLSKARIYEVANVELFTTKHLTEYVENLISTKDLNIEGFDEKHERIKLPENIVQFAQKQIPKWVESCLAALAFQENVHYIVDDGQVKPVDYETTGIIQSSTNWNCGLHQFLQIKHGLKLTSESLTTNYMSNMAMIKKYGSNIIGFTGTLGSISSREFLNEVYNLQQYIVPETYFKKYVRFPDIVIPCDDREEWLQQIATTCLQEISKKRGVLIICKTIQEADLVAETFKQFQSVNVKVYTKNAANQEKQIERIHPGDVIVATNLAGRGTDIKSDEIEEVGGLHVCLTFLPTSLRVEEQAFGRTSRQGRRGTGQLIVLGGDSVRNNEDFAVTDNDYDNSQSNYSTERDDMETKELMRFLKTGLPVMKLKDDIFNNFTKLIKHIRQDLKRDSLTGKMQEFILATVHRSPQPPSFTEMLFLQAVEERWAMFLKEVEDGKILLAEAKKRYKEFEDEIQDDLSTPCREEVICKTLNPFYFIQLGNYEYKEDSKVISTLSKADEYFSLAIKMNKEFTATALVGRANILLKDERNLVRSDSHKDGYKEEAMQYLEQSLPLLSQEMAWITVMQTLVQKGERNDWKIQNDLLNELLEKSSILGTFTKQVNETIDVVKRSLRRVKVVKTIHLDKHEASVELKTVMEMFYQSHVNEIRKFFEPKPNTSYQLSFHDLTSNSDIKTKDQAINTLSKVGKNKRLWSTSGSIAISLSVVDSIDWGEFIKLLANKNLKLNFNLEMVGLEIDGKYSVTFDFISIKNLTPSSYNIKLELDLSLKESEKLMEQIKRKQICPITFEFISHQELRIFQVNSWKNKIDLPVKDKMSAISCSDLKNKEEIEERLNLIVREIRNPAAIIGVSLTINSISMSQQDLSNLNRNFITHIINLNKNDAETVIHELRKLNLNFILHCQNMTAEAAKFLYDNADRQQENIVQSDLKELSSLFSHNHMPITLLRDLNARGIDILVFFNEKKFVPWCSIATMAGIAAVQAAVGGVLICTGFGATVGMGLITEGMADFMTAQRIYSTREFSWSQYNVQKAVSLTISAVSMGLSSLKDAAKGAKLLIEGAAQEVVEQAGTRVITNGKTLNLVIQNSGKNLKKLAMKTISVSVVETGAKVGLTAICDQLTGFCFEQARDGICKNIQERLDNHFHRKEFLQILSFYYVLNRRTLDANLKQIVKSTMNPSKAIWLQLWSSVAYPLCSGILSSPQFLGSTISQITLIWGLVSGMHEISTVVAKICDEIRVTLKSKRPALEDILQTKCGLSIEYIEKVARHIKYDDFETTFDIEIPKDASSEQWKNIKEKFKNMKEAQQSFVLSNVSLLLKWIADEITNHIVQIANMHMVSPLMSTAVGNLVSKISNELQDRFLVNPQENTEEQNKIQQEVEDIKKKPKSEWSEKEKQFMKDNDHPNTFANQIKYNAKDYQLAWQKRQLAAAAKKTKTSDTAVQATADKKLNREETGTKELQKYKENISNGGAADMATMFSMASDNNVDLKIVDDPNYKPTQEDIKSGVHIAVYQKGENINDIGHWNLMSTNGNLIEISNSEGENCGYEVMSHITGKSIEQLRIETGQSVINNSRQFQEIVDLSKWIHKRYPLEATCQLMIGGMERKRVKFPRISLIKESPKLFNKAKKLVENACNKLGILEKTPKDGQGFIYMYRQLDDNYKPVHEEDGYYKIGMTKQAVEKRVSQSATKNKEIYEIVGEFPCDHRKMAERLTHSALSDYRKERSGGGDGFTEYFKGDPTLFNYVIETAIKHTNES